VRIIEGRIQTDSLLELRCGQIMLFLEIVGESQIAMDFRYCGASFASFRYSRSAAA
jgi:hypothetical protein